MRKLHLDLLTLSRDLSNLGLPVSARVSVHPFDVSCDVAKVYLGAVLRFVSECVAIVLGGREGIRSQSRIIATAIAYR
jgi:hypothetical protein